jgi:hypothetical protein
LTRDKAAEVEEVSEAIEGFFDREEDTEAAARFSNAFGSTRQFPYSLLTRQEARIELKGYSPA